MATSTTDSPMNRTGAAAEAGSAEAAAHDPVPSAYATVRTCAEFAHDKQSDSPVGDAR
jgi:hypothetical protein